MVKTKDTNLKIVDRSDEQRQKRAAEAAPWEEAEKQWRIPADELRQRVHVLRSELESYRSQLEALPFDIASGDFSTPISLDHSSRKYTLQLVEALDNRVNGAFEMLDSYARDHGCAEHLDFNSKLFFLKNDTAETAFRIGVLAGAIFAGCPKEKIDAFERGMVVSLTSDNGLVTRD